MFFKAVGMSLVRVPARKFFLGTDEYCVLDRKNILGTDGYLAPAKFWTIPTPGSILETLKLNLY